MRPDPNNLILIGMPASGKSTLGVMAAKALGWNFLDTDVLIQHQQGRTLKHIIETDGPQAFRTLENHCVTQLDLSHHVIATGGSVVFGAEAMAHFGRLGLIVWLKLGVAALEQRIGDLVARGVLHQPGQTLTDIYNERRPLYERYAHAVLACDGKPAEALVQELVEFVQS